MKYRWDKKYLYWGLTAFLVIVCSIAVCLLFIRADSVAKGIGTVTGILMPFFYGFIFAYLLTPVMTFLEVRFLRLFTTHRKRIKQTKAQKIARVISIALSLLLALLAIAALISMLIPQLISSLSGFLERLPIYVSNVESWLARFLNDNPDLAVWANNTLLKVTQSLESWLEDFLPSVNQMLSSLTIGLSGFLTVLKNVVIGIIISVYVMYSKEKFGAQAKKLLYALFNPKGINNMLSTLRTTNRMFLNFFVGKLLDSLIIGLICFILMSIFRMPFALLISVIIGVTNIIPFFGPFIGAIPCALLLLLENPITSLYFVLLILVLQQFDGNILGPKILGDSTGLSSFWVIFSILLSGGLFGFLGMIAGVPIFAVIYTFIKLFLDKKLTQKGLPTDSDDYMNVDHITEEQQMVPKVKQ